MVRRPLNLDDIPDLMDIIEAADIVGMHPLTIRRAIYSGELEATIPRGRAPLRAGRSQGYRITRAALQRWYFNEPEPVETKEATS